MSKFDHFFQINFIEIINANMDFGTIFYKTKIRRLFKKKNKTICLDNVRKLNQL